MTPDPIMTDADAGLPFADYVPRSTLRAAFQPGPITAPSPEGTVEYPDGRWLVQDPDDDGRLVVLADPWLLPLLYRRVGADLPDTAEGLAQWLAERSQHPRYGETGFGWQGVLASPGNVRHAAAEAVRHGHHDAAIAAEQLLALVWGTR